MKSHNYGKWELPQNWYFEETPSHGYLYPTQEANKNVPAFIREQNYEEDCAWSIPVFFNPSLFPEDCIKAAKKTFINWYPKEYEKAMKVTLQKGESSQKDDNYFARLENIGKYEKSGGYGDWCFDVPKGKVYATLVCVVMENVNHSTIVPQGERIGVLMDSKTYNDNQYFTPDMFELYTRNEEYYTWDSYTKATGKERYK